MHQGNPPPGNAYTLQTDWRKGKNWVPTQLALRLELLSASTKLTPPTLKTNRPIIDATSPIFRENFPSPVFCRLLELRSEEN